MNVSLVLLTFSSDNSVV